VYVPDVYSERHFMDGKFPEYCAFLRDRGLPTTGA
jgi:hypothetical protein